MTRLPGDVACRFRDVADAVAFLDGEYGDSAEEIAERRAAQLRQVIESWCAAATMDEAVRLAVAARELRRARSVARPAADVTCPECGKAYSGSKRTARAAVSTGSRAKSSAVVDSWLSASAASRPGRPAGAWLRAHLDGAAS